MSQVSDELERSSESRTKQSMKDDCDINFIVARYRRTGALEHVARGVPVFADVADVGEYREVLERLRAAEEYFLTLPAKVREQFGNDPVEYVAALGDPAAQDRLRDVVMDVLGDRREPAQDRREGDREAPVVPEGGEPA